MSKPWFIRVMVGTLILLAVGLRLGFFVISTTRVQPSSDESITVLMAEAIHSGQFPLLFTGQPYMFPLESYLLAPFTSWLPHNAFGARIGGFILTLVGLLLSLRLAATTLRGWGRLAAFFLIAVPSAYVLMMQSAYALPGYPSLLLLLPVMATLSLGSATFTPLATGLVGGLAFSAHMLALPGTIMFGLATVLGREAPEMHKRAIQWCTGLLVGLIPNVATGLLHPSAHRAVVGMVPPMDFVRRIWDPALKHTLPAALGFNPPPFPDEHRWVLLSHGASLMAACMALVLLGTGLHLAWRSCNDWRKGRGLRLSQLHLYWGLMALNIAAFAASARASAAHARYLLPAAWAMPFVAGCILQTLRARARPLGVAAIVLLLALNTYVDVRLIQLWHSETFTHHVAPLPDLAPVLSWLREHGCQHAVGSYGTAYRITYLSDGAVTGAQPVNERFPGWPIPYKDEVDAASNVAFVLTDRVSHFHPSKLAEDLATMRVGCLCEHCGEYTIFHRFTPSPDPPLLNLPPNAIRMNADSNRWHIVRNLDEAAPEVWRTHSHQQLGDTFSITWPKTLPLAGMTVVYGLGGHDIPLSCQVECLTTEGWRTVLPSLLKRKDRFVIENAHPVYGRPSRQTTCWPSVQALGLRLTITDPAPNACWTLVDIQPRGDTNTSPIAATGRAPTS